MTVALIFQTSTDAYNVGCQLPTAQIIENVLYLTKFDKPAFDLALALAGLTNDDFAQLNTSSRLPFPKHERECQDMRKPRIEVICQRAWDLGYIHGMWIDASKSFNKIMEDIEWMRSWSPVDASSVDVGYRVKDSDNFAQIDIFTSPYSHNIRAINLIAKLLKKYGNAMGAFIDSFEDIVSEPILAHKPKKVVELFKKHYCGTWGGKEDFVENSDVVKVPYKFEDLPEYWAQRINWKDIAVDLFANQYRAVNNRAFSIHVFRNY